jgi:hypothetical protein
MAKRFRALKKLGESHPKAEYPPTNTTEALDEDGSLEW